MRYWLLKIGLVLALSGCELADSQDGLRAYQRGEYARAQGQWRILAEEGDASAQYNLGQMYLQGKGVPQDYAEAAKWFRLAAEQGHTAARHNLGVMHANGQGVTRDYAEAAKWYRLAAEQGHAAACNNLGVMYVNGQGVGQDYVQAHLWYSLAAASGITEAAENRDNLARRMSSAEIAKAQRLASNMGMDQ